MKTIEILRKLEKETPAEVYIVGGFARDFLRNKKNYDIDVVVRKIELSEVGAFLEKHGKVKTIKLSKVENAPEVEILLFKAFNDTAEAQISLPKKGKSWIYGSDVKISYDVRHRDFTINSLYLPIAYKTKDDIIDLVGGRRDIQRKLIRTHGNPSIKIKESPIRMMRAVSLAARTNYAIDRLLLESIKEHADLIRNAPVEAVRAELDEILSVRKPSEYLGLMHKAGLLKHVCPELDRCVGVKQDKKYHKFDVFTHIVRTVDSIDKNEHVLRLAGLFHDVGKPDTKETCGGHVTFHKHEAYGERVARTALERLRYPKKVVDEVTSLIKHHMYYYEPLWASSTVRKFIVKVGLTEEYMVEERIGEFPLFKLRRADRLGHGSKNTAVTNIQKEFEERILKEYRASNGLTIKDLNIDGDVVIEHFKLKPGIQVGTILKYLLANVLKTPEFNNRLDLLKLTAEYIYYNNEKQQ